MVATVVLVVLEVWELVTLWLTSFPVLLVGLLLVSSGAGVGVAIGQSCKQDNWGEKRCDRRLKRS
jgi:hypothetical protein